MCLCAYNTLASYRACAYFQIIGVGRRGRNIPAGCTGLWLGAVQCAAGASVVLPCDRVLWARGNES